jgi:tetratricopeptide (TPR) repeat protein
MDQSLYLVLPFRHRSQSAPRLLNGDQCESLLHDALGRWHGVQLVDPLWVADARSRRGGSSSIADGLSIARERRAGRVVLGEVWEFKDTIYVRGLLYDAGGQKLVREQAVRIAPDLRDAQVRFEELADSLLIGGGVATSTPPRGGDRLSLPAWRAYQDAYLAMQRWDLDSAKARLQRALAIDPSYGMAQLSLAQVLAWSGEEAQSWRGYAAGALSSADSLPARERGLAEGMLAMADLRFPEACERFRALVARDSLDFAAWFGLGECQGKDPLVERDRSSPSGWKFRGSYQAAVTAYRRALEIVPSVHLAFRGEGFSRLPQLLYTETNQIRRGYAFERDTVRFGAFPSLSHDTLAFVPWRIQEVTAGIPRALPPTLSPAVQHNRDLMRDIATVWVQAFPGRADAHEALGRVLESLGEVTAGRDPDRSALGEIRQARRLAKGTAGALRLAATEVRLLLKAEQPMDARLLADSLLSAASSTPRAEDAEQLIGPAALTGRLHLAADLQRRAATRYTFLTPEGNELHLPLPLTEAALSLLAYSSFGTPVDSIATLEQRVERLISSYIDANQRNLVRQVVLDRPAVLAFPERGRRPAHRPGVSDLYLLTLQWELVNGDTSKVRREFQELRRLRARLRPGDVAFDATYHEARLLLALGDTAGASSLLDLSLDALPTLGPDLLDQLPQVATLVRGMALRAELAAQTGDSAEAKRRARNVLALWAAADSELQPTLRRMRAIVE